MQKTRMLFALGLLALLSACADASVSRSDSPRDLFQTEMQRSLMLSL